MRARKRDILRRYSEAKEAGCRSRLSASRIDISFAATDISTWLMITIINYLDGIKR